MKNKISTPHYHEKTNSWRFYIKGKTVTYSVRKYGPIAEKLCYKSFENKKRYESYIEDFDNFAIMYIYSRPLNQIFEVYIDIEDIEKVEAIKWYINIPQNARTMYIASDKNGKLHRFVMNEKDPAKLIDHINRNGLDNRKANLRVTNNSENKKNMHATSVSKTGYNGVTYSEEQGYPNYTVTWIDENRKQRKKRFYISHFKSKEECFNYAIQFRKNKEEEHGYISN